MAFQCKPTEVLLQNVRLSFVHLLEPYTNPNNFSEAKYSAMILVPNLIRHKYKLSITLLKQLLPTLV